MKKNLLFLTLAMSGLIFSCQKSTEKQVSLKMQKDFPAPPTVAQKPQTFTEHGKPRTDNYFWLKDKANPEVITYLKAENTYADTVLQHTQALQDKLFAEMKARIKEEDESVPVLQNGYYYNSRTVKDKQYRVQVRRKSPTAPEEILIDGNARAEGKPAFIFSDYEVSPDNKILAYADNFTGSYAEFTLQFKDLATGKDLPERIEKTSGNFVWANDNKTVFYSIVNNALRAYRVYKHILGTDVKTDQLVYEEKDEQFNAGVGKSKNSKWIMFYSGSFTSTEMSLLPADQPEGQMTVFQKRQKDVQYSVEPHNDRFFILYKDNENKNYKVMEAPLNGFADRKNWKDFIPYDPKVKIENIDAYEKYLAFTVRKDGLVQIKTMNLADKKENTISFNEPTYDVTSGGNPEYNATTLRYVYTSLNRPSTVYDYDMTTGKSTQLKVDEIPGGFKPEEYEVKRLFAKTKDGVEVPVSLIYKKGFKQDGLQPLFLEGYGSYGYSYDPAFNRNIISLLDRGFAYAIAHIRGGADLGENWYEDGKLMKKKNTFDDFIAVAEHLIAEKYTVADKLVIQGGSAGGLLMGAVTNLRPDLFKVVIAQVPFVDVMNTMMDTSLPLTTQEYEQWGNPNEKEAYDYILSYSPYDNVEKKNYPNILATAGLNDSQVSYHEAAKWVAKLRSLKTDQNLVLLHTNMESGHGGATGRFDRLKETAFNYAFILDRLGRNE
jgi:oligopeptidase B